MHQARQLYTRTRLFLPAIGRSLLAEKTARNDMRRRSPTFVSGAIGNAPVLRASVPRLKTATPPSFEPLRRAHNPGRIRSARRSVGSARHKDGVPERLERIPNYAPSALGAASPSAAWCTSSTTIPPNLNCWSNSALNLPSFRRSPRSVPCSTIWPFSR